MKPAIIGGGAPKLSAYNPTLRDRAATSVLGMLGNPNPNSPLGQLVSGILGSTGAGGMGNNILGGNGLIDLTPFGVPFMADEAGRQMASGHPLAGAASLAMALPLPVGKAAQAAKGLIGSAGRKAVAEAAQTAVSDAGKAAAPIIAYHGSPHAFDKFDTAKIGTGEGAQAYGHGLYFAENEKTAKAYRDQLAGYLVNGRDPNDGEAYAIQALDAAGGDPKRALAMHEDAKRQYPGWNSPEGQKTLEQWAAQGAPAITSPGHTYQVGINAHPDHFLDWDKPLSEQPAHVQAVLGDTPNETAGAKLSRAYRNPLYAGDIVGADKATPDELSAHLGAQGIPGIKYLDQGSRTAGDGTRNYVVFNPEHIDILKRYGIPATVFGTAGAAAAASGMGQQQDDGASGL
jgi:hypothetical protein